MSEVQRPERMIWKRPRRLRLPLNFGLFVPGQVRRVWSLSCVSCVLHHTRARQNYRRVPGLDQLAQRRCGACSRPGARRSARAWKPREVPGAYGRCLCELKIDFGPGYRVYYTERGGVMIVLLAGGDKSTQSQDVRKAIAPAKNLLGVPRHAKDC